MGSNPIALPKEINNLRYFSLVIIEPDFSQGNTWDNSAPLHAKEQNAINAPAKKHRIRGPLMMDDL